MAKRSNLPRPALSNARGGASGPSRSSIGARGPRDPITRLLLFSELMGLGLVAAAIYLKFPNDLAQKGVPAVTLDYFGTFLEKATFVAVHTRTVWIVLAVISTLTAALAYKTRHAPKRSRIVVYAPIAALLVIALHAGAQAWLASRGPLYLEFRGPAPAGMEGVGNLPLTMPATAGAAQRVQLTVRAVSVQRLTVFEGTRGQWQMLLGGDLLFSVPLLFAWVMSFARNAGLTPAAHA